MILLSRDTQKLADLCTELEACGVENNWKNSHKPVHKHFDIEKLRDKSEQEIIKELESVRALALNSQTIDVLVNNAGLMSYGSFKESPIEVVRRVMEVNYFGQVALTRSLLEHIPDDGSIVNIGSILGRVALPYQGAYSASKHAFQVIDISSIHIFLFENIGRIPLV